MTPVPHHHITGPVETGPVETGPVETGPVEIAPVEIAPVETVWTTVGSPLGELLLTGAVPPTDGAHPGARGGRSTAAVLTGLYYPGHTRGRVVRPGWREDPAAFAEVATQLAAYFRGARTTFSVPVRTVGTPFQERVWEALRDVPFGTTTTYGELAHRVGRPGAARAVGAAVGRNPVSVIVPCHRVVGRSGTLTGYAGGVARKEHLLALEGVLATAAAERKVRP